MLSLTPASRHPMDCVRIGRGMWPKYGQVRPTTAKDGQAQPRMAKDGQDGQGWPRMAKDAKDGPRRPLRISREFADGPTSCVRRARPPERPAANGENRQKLPLSLVSCGSEWLTETVAEPYIGSLGCAAATARWRVREAPHCLHGDRASGHAHGHVRVTASNARGLCCLTSESEERETWTAESLRAACRAGASFA